MHKHGNSAFVVGFAGIVVDQLMQLRARRYRGQQQDNPHQRDGQHGLADLDEMASHVLQIICSLAGYVP